MIKDVIFLGCLNYDCGFLRIEESLGAHLLFQMMRKSGMEALSHAPAFYEGPMLFMSFFI